MRFFNLKIGVIKMQNKFNDYLMRFNKDKEFFKSPTQAYQNKWFQKLNTLPVEMLPLLIAEFRDNNNHYLLPIICKFYPNFKILRKDAGRTKFIVQSLLEHIENNEPIK
jgi:hypothetical protein